MLIRISGFICVTMPWSSIFIDLKQAANQYETQSVIYPQVTETAGKRYLVDELKVLTRLANKINKLQTACGH